MQKIAEQRGLVISYFGSSVAVETEDGQVVTCQLHRNQALPVVGDYVRWQMETSETGVVLAIEPRRTLLTRGDGHGKTKPVAANVDHMLIVMAPLPIFSEYLIDRYLVAAELLQIAPVLVLNKIDLLDETALTFAQQRLLPYQQIPYPIILSSMTSHQGLQALKDILQAKTAVLVGPSGVGKSSIIAALTGGNVIRVGAVSAKGIGKHTTTATRLYHLPQGGCLIDSPGVREFNLWAVNKQEILQGFKEFHSLLGNCKFRDCQHMAEPGCQIQAAVQAGKLSPGRYESYQALIKKVANQHDR